MSNPIDTEAIIADQATRAAIEAELVATVYWANRRAKRQLLGKMPAPEPDAAAYALLARVQKKPSA
jgi:hypothetical protein